MHLGVAVPRISATRACLRACHLVAPSPRFEQTLVNSIGRCSVLRSASGTQVREKTVFAGAAAGFAMATQRRSGSRRGTATVAAASTSEDEQIRVAADGDEVLVHYKGMLTDGTVFDASDEERGPLNFQVGARQVVPGFEAAVRGMKVGEKITATLSPEEAYGPTSEDLVITAPKEQAPDGLQEGMRVMLGSEEQQIPAIVTEIKPYGSVVLDANPPLAGRTLVFEIELVGFKEPPQTP